MRTKIATVVCVLGLVLGGTVQSVAGPAGQTAVKAADAVIVRPLCFASTVVGGALFVLSLPVTAATKRIKPTADVLVVKPARATFKRPLGDIDALAD